MEDNKFISGVTSADFDKALQGGLDAANGKFAKAEDIPDVPVKSVNGKTGAVQLGAEDVGARPASWTPSAADVGADPKGTASGAVSAHNVSGDAHNDIRLLIEGLTTRLNTLADSDDTTLDQMSEVVAYIKANKALIDSITTSKVNVSDIINNLTTNASGKPLSAAQGVALKRLIDGLSTGKLDATAVADWAKAATKPSYNKSEVGLGNVDNVKQYSSSNPPPYPVTSVNGKVGAVTVDVPQVVQEIGESASAVMSQKAVANAIMSKGVPNYVTAEADRVTKVLLELQGENTFTFAAVSDVHVNCGGAYEENTQTSISHAAMAMKRVASQVGVDVMVNLGDNLWGTNTDVANAKAEQLIMNQLIYDAFKDHPNMRLVGNHEANLWNAYIPTAAIYATNGRYNDFDVVGETRMRGYGYKDFPLRKLRVIGLNTSDYIDNKGGYAVSDEQKLWLMKSLDLSAKADAAEWQVLLLSHIPLDYPSGDWNTPADISAILLAYQNGSAVTVSAGSYNYSGKNKAQIVGNIHGHLHNFSRGNMAGNNIVRVCTPNTCYYNNGAAGTGHDELYQPNETYNKTAGTAQDTTVTFYTIDLEHKIIYSTNYGAGYDRQISYDGTGTKTTYPVTNSLSNAVSSNSTTAVLEGSVYAATITAKDGYTLDGATVSVKMGGVDITASAYSAGVISIPSVTGAIVINVTAAQEEAFSYAVDDLAVGVRQSIYGVKTNGTLDYANSNTRMIIGCSTENVGAIATRENTTIYLIPIPEKATKVTLTTTDQNLKNVSFQGYNHNGSVFTKAFDSVWRTDFTYQFAKGSAAYLAIMGCYDDDPNVAGSVNVPWSYKVKDYNTVTFE